MSLQSDVFLLDPSNETIATRKCRLDVSAILRLQRGSWWEMLNTLALHLGGKLIDAELVSILRNWQKRPDGSCCECVITVDFSFLDAQSGERIYGKASETRNDLVNKALPRRGTRLAILYLNKNWWAVL